MTNDAMLRVRLPQEVRDRLAAEARRKGLPLATHVRDLIVARDAKLQAKVSGNAHPVDP